MTVQRSTQSIAMTPAESEAVKLAARGRNLSVSAWGYGRVAAAMSSKTAAQGALVDLSEVTRRAVSTSDRTKRISIQLTVPDYAALKAMAAQANVSAHALAQAILICEAERALGSIPRKLVAAGRPAPVTPDKIAAALPDDVAEMLAALDMSCWPYRDTPPADDAGEDAAYAAAVVARQKVRMGMKRLRSHAGRDRTDVELIATALLDHPVTLTVSAMVALPLADVARGVALRCLLNRERAAASWQDRQERFTAPVGHPNRVAVPADAPSASELARMVADALNPV